MKVMLAAAAALACGLSAAAAQEPDPALPENVRTLLAEAKGVGSATLADTVKVAQGEVAPGQEIVSVGFRHLKTGTITDAVTVPTWAGPMNIAAGTPVYAAVFSGPPTGGELPIRVGWCAPRFTGPITKAGERGICVFRTKKGDAQFAAVSKFQSPFSADSVDMAGAKRGAWPNIVAGPVELGADLRRAWVLGRVDPKRITVRVLAGDAARMPQETERKLEVKNGAARLEAAGGEFRLRISPSGKTVLVETIKAPAPEVNEAAIEASPLPKGFTLKGHGISYEQSGAVTVLTTYR